MQKKVKYCWQCGRPVGPEQKNCYYCPAEIHRQIKEPHKCPYCFGEIHPQATKCPHCGEFLIDKDDKTEKESTTKEKEKLVFVIPAQLTPDKEPIFIPAGEEVAEEYRQRLGSGTIKAIEMNNPNYIDNPTVKALPSSEAVNQSPKALLPDGRPLMIEDNHSEVIDVPAKKTPQTGQLTKSITDKVNARSIGNALVKGAGFVGPLLKKALSGNKGRVTATVVEDEEEDLSPTRICVQCDAEILRTDNYCYHCGFKYVKKTRSSKLPSTLISNTGHYVAIVLILCSYMFLSSKGYPSYIDWLPVFAVLIAIVGIFRKFTIDSISFLVISLGALIYFLSQ